jgi:hypothetical protein
VLHGNIAPAGAIIKPAAASPHLIKHRGRALVFDGIEDFHARIDDPELDMDANTVLVLRGCGSKGYPGMPEVSNMPLPSKLLEQGVRDMVRICDGREWPARRPRSPERQDAELRAFVWLRGGDQGPGRACGPPTDELTGFLGSAILLPASLGWMRHAAGSQIPVDDPVEGHEHRL